MQVNCKKEIKNYQAAMIKHLQGWVKINSALDESSVGPNAPFGKGPHEALVYIAKVAEKDGFKVDRCDGYVTEITYDVGAQDSIAILGHCDVVPLGEGWKHNPLGGEVIDNVIYGRGVLDDKGPTSAAYFALKIIRDLKLPLKHNVRIVVGGNEETGSRCLYHYFRELKRPAPKYGFTPDAEFPLIYGEKGIMGYVYSGNIHDSVIESLEAGVATNAVPASCKLVFRKVMNLEKEFKDYCAKHNFSGDYQNDKDGKTVILMHGKAAHGSTPELGVNALTVLLKFVANQDVSEIANHFGPKLCCYYGKRLGINGSGPKMGYLTMNVGIGSIKDDKYYFILDIRYPIDLDYAKIVKQLDSQKMHEGKARGNSKPLYLDPHSKMIETLLRIYQEVSGDYESKPMTIGGGTYARSTENTVAYGMDFLTHRGNGTQGMHSPDEGLCLDDYWQGCEIYVNAIYELGNLD
jgi:succinyl-diaminopimelate desuccinylase